MKKMIIAVALAGAALATAGTTNADAGDYRDTLRSLGMPYVTEAQAKSMGGSICNSLRYFTPESVVDEFYAGGGITYEAAELIVDGAIGNFCPQYG